MAFTEAQVLEALQTAMSASYTRGLGAAKPQWDKVATKVPSAAAANNYGWMKDLPGIAEWTGDRQLATLDAHGYQIANKTWESSIKINKDNFDDNQLGIYSVLAEKYGQDVALFPDSLVYALLKAGFSTLCFDGQYFFDTDHPMAGSTYSNIVGTGAETGEPWFLLDTSQVVKPIIYQERRPFVFQNMQPNSEYTWFNNSYAAGVDGRCNVGFGFWQTAVGSKAALTVENYEAAIQKMAGTKKDNGEPLGVHHTTLVTGYSNRAAAMKILKASMTNGGDTNVYFNDAELVVSPYITA